MKPKISIVTLGVADVSRSVRFYRDGLGFPTHNYTEGDDFVMFALEGTFLAVYPREALSGSANAGSGSSGFGLSHNEPAPAAVDATFAEAVAAGAIVVKRPEKVFWGGYSGEFTDPDGHLWEVAHNPFTDLT